MTNRCPHTDRLMTLMGLDPDYHASEEGRRRFADAYGRNRRNIAVAIARGGDPETLELVPGAISRFRMEVRP